jgi:hypothetical protein
MILEEAKADVSARYMHDYKHSFSRGGLSGKGILSQPAEERKRSTEKVPHVLAWDNKLQLLKDEESQKGMFQVWG